MTDKLHRTVTCLLAWCLPLIGNRLALTIAPPSGGEQVDMFGLTSIQFQAAVVGTVVGAAAGAGLLIVKQLGWRWLTVAVPLLIAGTWAAGALEETPLVQDGRPVVLGALIVAPIVGGWVTNPPVRRTDGQSSRRP